MKRREFLAHLGRFALAIPLVGLTGLSLRNVKSNSQSGLVWQIDPYKCIQCGQCQTECVLSPSAVKCVHAHSICGYCRLCGGYYHTSAKELDTAAENQICPTKAIQRTFIEDPYYEYNIREELCIGCGKCVKGCGSFGNGSLFLQIRHNICVNCNECAIARKCPSQAFCLVPKESPYLWKGIHVSK